LLSEGMLLQVCLDLLQPLTYQVARQLLFCQALDRRQLRHILGLFHEAEQGLGRYLDSKTRTVLTAKALRAAVTISHGNDEGYPPPRVRKASHRVLIGET